MSDASVPEPISADREAPAARSDQLDEAVLAVPGVDALYAAAPLVATVIATAVEAVTGRPKSNSAVSVAEKEEGLEIAVKIGVSLPYAATDVSRRVHDAIAERLDSNGSAVVAKIVVTVARID